MGIATQYEGGLKFDGDQMYITTSSGTTLLTIGNTGSANFVGAITTPNLYLGGGSVRLSPGTNGEVGINYNTSATGSLVWYAGGTDSKFNVTNAGNATFAGTIGATNFSGSSSGTNTGDQTLPTLSSLGALSTSAAASTYLPLAGGTMTGALNATGGLYFRGDANMGFVPYPIGAQFRSDSSSHTGYIKIKLPTDTGDNPDDMMSFYVDIYDYTTNEMISVFVGGYTYRTTSTSTYWYNTTAIVTAGKTDKNFTVRFGNDGTHYYVAIGETSSTWAHPSIVVRDFQCSYRSAVVHYVDGWDIDITASTLEGVDETNSNNFPAGDYNKLINTPSLLQIGTTATTAMAGNTLSAQDITDIGNLSGTNTGDQDLSSYYNSGGSTYTKTTGTHLSLKNTTSSGYSEFNMSNDAGHRLVMGSVGSTYSNTAWAGSRYIYSSSGELRIKAATNLRLYSGGNDHTGDLAVTFDSSQDATFTGTITVGGDLGVNGFIKDSLYKHAGNTNWRTKKYVRSVGITGGDIGDSWVQLSRVVISSTYEKVTIKFTINGYDDVSSGVEAIDVRYENGSAAQENHQCAWYSTDDHANLFKQVRSIRSASNGLSNTYDLYVQMAGDWRDSFTVVAEEWTTHGDNASIAYTTANGSATEPSAGSNDIERGERRWYTENSYMYLGGNRVYTTGDFTNNSSNWDTAYGWGNHASAGYLTAHPSITEAADVDNSGGTVIQDLTFDDNGHVTATGSVNLDNIYTSTDGTENDYRFGLNLSNFSGTRWYKVATVNVGSGGLRIRGMMTNHVESFGSNMIDLAIQGREGNNNNDIEVTGHVHVLHQNAGIAIYSGEKPGSYTHWDVYVVATQYTQCQLDLTAVSGSFDTSGNYVTTEPTGTLELETYQLAEGNYVIRDSAAKRIFDSGINLAGGLSYTPSTNTLTQTDNNTTYSVATTSANGLMSSTDKTKLDGVATGANVTPSWVPSNDPSYLTSLPSHNHNSLYYTEDETRLALARINGWEAGYGSGTASNIKWNLTEEALELKHDSDSSIGAVYKAVWMEAGETKRWTVMIRGSQVTSNGMYIRLYQHDGNLPDGKTHVSNDAQGTFVQEDDRSDTGWYENGAISDSWTNFEREYKAPAAGYVSLVVLNWTGNGVESLFIKTPDIQTVYATVESGSIGISQLAVSDGSSGQVLTTNGSGTLSFSTVASGSDTNYYLDGVTRTDSTNTLVFSVNGATNQSFTFGANAFNSTTIPAAEAYTAHEDTSTLSGVYGDTANGTKIDTITVDANGHITAVATGATGNMTGFFVEDGDGTEVQINNANEWKFVEGAGIDINWSDTSTGSDTDPYDLTIACTIDSPGEVGLGNLSSSGNALAGTFTATGDLIAYSDARVKENVETIPNALEKVTALRGVNFNKIGEEKRSTGVIAQEVKEVFPEVVHETEDGMLAVAYGNITGVLIEAIKEQQKQIDELKSRLDGFTK